MKNTFKKITALTLSILTVGALTSCNKDKPEDISDSQESSVDDVNENEKITLTISTPFPTGQISSAVSEYNRKQDNYTIEIKNYFTLTEYETNADLYEDALNQMKLDMVSGQTVDIIAIEAPYMETFVNLGIFEDMYGLMQQYGGIKKEDLLPNILEGFERDGKLPAISYMFTLQTAVAKTEYVGNDAINWTPSQAIEAYNSMPDDMTFFKNGETDLLAQYLLTSAVQDFVSLKNYSCSFDSPAFIDLLTLACDNPKGSNIGNDSLVKGIVMNGFNAQSGGFYSAFNGDEITFVGYPSENGYGAVADCGLVYGISESSEHKEAAWEFINTMFTKNYQKKIRENSIMHGFPVVREVFDEQAFEYDTDAMSGNNTWNQIMQTYENNPEGMKPEEAMQKLYDYVTTVKFNPYYNTTLNNIVEEEYAAAINGEKKPEETADLIQNRISIYLSERS